MNKFILIDSGFWFALYDPRDGFYSAANNIVDLIEDNVVLIPWPTLYETINTRFCRNSNILSGFETFLKKSNTRLIDDLKYRENDLLSTFSSHRNFSLVDRVIRSILTDNDLKIDYLITFNPKDFVDLCSIRRIEILN